MLQHRVSLTSPHATATSLNTIKKKFFIVIYDEMESSLAQINAIRCRSIIMQMNTSAQRLFMSLQRIFFLVPEQHQHLLQIRQRKGPLRLQNTFEC